MVIARIYGFKYSLSGKHSDGKLNIFKILRVSFLFRREIQPAVEYGLGFLEAGAFEGGEELNTDV